MRRGLRRDPARPRVSGPRHSRDVVRGHEPLAPRFLHLSLLHRVGRGGRAQLQGGALITAYGHLRPRCTGWSETRRQSRENLPGHRAAAPEHRRTTVRAQADVRPTEPGGRLPDRQTPARTGETAGLDGERLRLLPGDAHARRRRNRIAAGEVGPAAGVARGATVRGRGARRARAGRCRHGAEPVAARPTRSSSPASRRAPSLPCQFCWSPRYPSRPRGPPFWVAT